MSDAHRIRSFLDFMATLSSPELCALAGVRGTKLSNDRLDLPGTIEAFEKNAGFAVMDPHGNLKPVFHQIAVGAVKYDENRDSATFDREAGEKAYTSTGENPSSQLKSER